MVNEKFKEKACEWSNLQVLAYDEETAGNHAKAREYRAAAEAIERELKSAGTDIRCIVCPS